LAWEETGVSLSLYLYFFSLSMYIRSIEQLHLAIFAASGQAIESLSLCKITCIKFAVPRAL
jgi:hypothetical protein